MVYFSRSPLPQQFLPTLAGMHFDTPSFSLMCPAIVGGTQQLLPFAQTPTARHDDFFRETFFSLREHGLQVQDFWLEQEWKWQNPDSQAPVREVYAHKYEAMPSTAGDYPGSNSWEEPASRGLRWLGTTSEIPSRASIEFRGYPGCPEMLNAVL